jgi:hypothetical protein
MDDIMKKTTKHFEAAKDKFKQVAKHVTEAVGVSGAAPANPALYTAQDIEMVMGEMTTKALAAGITDPDKLRDLKIQAKEEFIAERLAKGS